MVQELKNSEDDITVERFQDPATWEKLRDILHSHPNSITRHEACYVAGELNIASLIPDLMQVATEDPSIVARHEAIEALGSMKGSKVPSIISFLASLKANQNNDPLLEHEDIIATIETAENQLSRATDSPQNFAKQ